MNRNSNFLFLNAESREAARETCRLLDDCEFHLRNGHNETAFCPARLEIRGTSLAEEVWWTLDPDVHTVLANRKICTVLATKGTPIQEDMPTPAHFWKYMVRFGESLGPDSKVDSFKQLTTFLGLCARHLEGLSLPRDEPSSLDHDPPGS